MQAPDHIHQHDGHQPRSAERWAWESSSTRARSWRALWKMFSLVLLRRSLRVSGLGWVREQWGARGAVFGEEWGRTTRQGRMGWRGVQCGKGNLGGAVERGARGDRSRLKDELLGVWRRAAGRGARKNRTRRLGTPHGVAHVRPALCVVVDGAALELHVRHGVAERPHHLAPATTHGGAAREARTGGASARGLCWQATEQAAAKLAKRRAWRWWGCDGGDSDWLQMCGWERAEQRAPRK